MLFPFLYSQYAWEGNSFKFFKLYNKKFSYNVLALNVVQEYHNSPELISVFKFSTLKLFDCNFFKIFSHKSTIPSSYLYCSFRSMHHPIFKSESFLLFISLRSKDNLSFTFLPFI